MYALASRTIQANRVNQGSALSCTMSSSAVICQFARLTWLSANVDNPIDFFPFWLLLELRPMRAKSNRRNDLH